MQRELIPVKELVLRPFSAWDDGWFLLTAGENAGRRLRHDRVVRHLQGPWQVLGDTHASEAGVPLPADADIGAMGLVLFAESSVTGEGLQAMELPLSACGPE